MNRFDDCTSIEEVVFQAIGAGSMCWQDLSEAGTFDDANARRIGDEAVAKLREWSAQDPTWLCPNCWKRWPVSTYCLDCGPHPPIGLYRHPPVDPVTGEVSAGDSAILMGERRHCDVPERYRRNDCTAVMNDHGWFSDCTRDGTTVCPPWGTRG